MTTTQNQQHTQWMYGLRSDGECVLRDIQTKHALGIVYSEETAQLIVHSVNTYTELLAALERIAWQGDYKPTDEELDGEDGRHYLQILGRWDAGEVARAAIQRARGEAVDPAPETPYSEPVRTEDSPSYRAAMRDAGRGGLLR